MQLWKGQRTDLPPPWMSMTGPMWERIIAEHSKCQPGRPGPQGLGHWGSPALAAFHRAKSAGLRLRASPATLCPAWWPSASYASHTQVERSCGLAVHAGKKRRDLKG